ncbi:MAG: hypothetical protein IIW14_02860, partial [Kiritimatiellae bacterium]|nr:hypothetical protein [Kiritimatiellia bacterium]
GDESGFNAEKQRGGEAENVLDRINKIDRIGENIADPQIDTNLHKSICGDKCGFVDCNSGEHLHKCVCV